MAKMLALLAAWAALLAAGAPAFAVEVLETAPVHAHSPSLAALPGQALLPVAPLSELPEPDVFAMMLLGLVLIGYRASRDSNEKFK